MLSRMLESKIDEALSLLVGEPGEARVFRPSVAGFGELTCSAAMQVFGRLKAVRQEVEFNTARDLAFEIKERLEKDEEVMAMIVRIEVAGPGFVNFHLSEKAFFEFLNSKLLPELGLGKKVLVEYSSPNIAKRFGVGHMRSTIIGQAILNSFKALGYDTVGDNHLGDWGTQFGIIIAAIEERGLDTEKMSVAELESLYVEYHKLIEEDESYMERAREAFARLESGEQKARAIWQAAKKTSVREFDAIYKRLGVRIDHAFGEAFYEQIMKEVVIPEVGKKLGKKSKGAVIVEFEKLPPAMLLKTNGTTTYFTRDLATVYHRQHDESLRADTYIYEVGAEQELHFKQVFEAAEMMGWVKPGQLVHVAHGLMRLPEGKISTRKGRNIRLEDLLDDAVREARSRIKGDMSEEEAGKISEIVGIGAVKFNELKHAPRTDYIFRMEEAVSLEGDSGPYVMYSAVRARAILDQAGEVSAVKRGNLDENEKKMLTQLLYFESMVGQAISGYSPNLLCSYLLETAGAFNQFYTTSPVLKASGDKRTLRLHITRRFLQTMDKGLSILGIALPARM